MLTCSLKKSERRGIPRKGVSILKPSAHEFDEVHNVHHHPGPHLAVTFFWSVDTLLRWEGAYLVIHHTFFFASFR